MHSQNNFNDQVLYFNVLSKQESYQIIKDLSEQETSHISINTGEIPDGYQEENENEMQQQIQSGQDIYSKSPSQNQQDPSQLNDFYIDPIMIPEPFEDTCTESYSVISQQPSTSHITAKSGGDQKQQKVNALTTKIVVPPKKRGKRSKQYRNDELAKKILRSISTEYHKAFLEKLTRKDKRGGDYISQRQRLYDFLQQSFHQSVDLLDNLFEDEEQREILDATFLTVKAKKESKAKKREDLFNGTKAKCRTLFRSDVGRIFFRSRFINSWCSYVNTRKMSRKCKQQYENYLSEIIDDC